MILLLSSLARADCLPVDPGATAARAREVWLSEERAEAAVSLVRAAEEGLSCLRAVPGPEDLGLLFETGAVAALAAGDRPTAVAWAKQARALAPSLQYDPRLGAAGAALWEQAASPARGTLHPRGPVWIDGLKVLSDARLPPGDHVVQWEEGGALHTERVPLSSGARVEVGPVVKEGSDHSTGRVVATLGGVAMVGVGAGLLWAGGDAYHELGREQGRGASFGDQVDSVKRVNTLRGVGAGLCGAGVVLTVAFHW